MRQLALLALLCAALPTFASRRVTDELGRSITIPDHPHRIVCLIPSVVDDVYALGDGADVIAIPDYTKYPPEARTKPSIGLLLSPSIETIVSLHPDLVLGSADYNRVGSANQLENLAFRFSWSIRTESQASTSQSKVLGTHSTANRLQQSLSRICVSVRTRYGHGYEANPR